MRFYADLHIHSKYSRACSKDCDLEHLAWWARRKGISVVGTGDFTHPAWFEHLCDALVPAEPGLFQLRPDLAREVDRRLPASCRGPVRFMLSVEIATIYKRAEQTRKVHHLIYVPDFPAARALTAMLAKVGNLASDGRPILGLDSRDLLEITLGSAANSYLVPAHIWTPWFSALGSKSGFDRVSDCYADLADHIFAVETGLSSDPPMNHRLRTLDGYRLVSNSDAHSPPMLAREATAFSTSMDYFAMRDALRTGEGEVETIEFFPEEGKYHWDGHRKCGLRLHPAETRAHADQRCPSCGKPLTVGVLHRVETLADRPEGFRPANADGFRNLVPLPEIVSEIRGVGPKSKTVHAEVASLVAQLGPELTVLCDTPLDDIARTGSPLLAEAIGRLRRGEVIRRAGYDGEYGTVRLFAPEEIHNRSSAPALFDVEAPSAARRPEAAGALPAAVPADGQPAGAALGPAHLPEFPQWVAPDRTAVDAAELYVQNPIEGSVEGSLLAALDPEQRAAASATGGPLLVVAGPGTGKTRTLTHRIAHLVTECGIAPESCLALTFTRRARAEMYERLTALAGRDGARCTVTTFHGLALAILREEHERAGLAAGFRVAEEGERLAVAEEVTGSARDARRLLAGRQGGQGDAEEKARFEKALRERGLVDVDGLVGMAVQLLADDPALAHRYRERFGWICVDEYQDVDERQYQLLRFLSRPESDLCAIGDPDQAIYGFRGADVGFFLRFQEDYPGARVVTLGRNYRSTTPIVAGATQAIRPSALVPDRTLRSVAAETPAARIGLHTAPDDDAEAHSVVTAIDRLLGGSSFHSLDSGRVSSDGTDGLSFSDIAVLYRTEAASRAVTDALTKEGMPFQKRSHDRLANRPGVDEIVRELRYRGTLALREAAEAAVGSLPPSLAGEREAQIRTAAELLTPLAQRCEGDLGRFLGELALGAEVDTWDPRADRVSLLTMHAAKGLEWPVVFLIGCEDGLLPLRWPGDPEASNLAEERRLLFVAMTRARSQLFLSHARKRRRHGKVQQVAPSPFLAAVEEELLARTGDERAKVRRRGRQLRLV